MPRIQLVIHNTVVTLIFFSNLLFAQRFDFLLFQDKESRYAEDRNDKKISQKMETIFLKITRRLSNFGLGFGPLQSSVVKIGLQISHGCYTFLLPE